MNGYDQQKLPVRPRGSRLVIAALILIIFGPVLWRWWPKEVARWYAAVASERLLEGDISAAEQALTAALRWDSESADLFRQRGHFFTEQGQYERALEDYGRAIELNPDDPNNLVLRSVALQHLGRYAAAIKDLEKHLEMMKHRGQEQLASALNGLAYARALGNTELDRALEEVNQALQFGDRRAENRAAMLDTRGYIQLRRGDLQEARQDLDRAIELMETLLAATAMVESYPDIRRQQQLVKLLEHHVAIMAYHRALVFEELGQSELAAEDLRRVRQLGHEPGDHLF